MSKIKDWIEDRDDETFVHTGSKFRSGWEKIYGSMTEWLIPLAPKGAEKEIKKVYEVCSNRARNMSDTKVTLVFDKATETAKTDGRIVTVGTKVMDEKGKTFAEKTEVMLGATTHEMAHIEHSNFDHFQVVLKNKPFERAIYNIIEDERIEALIGEELPGYAKNLAAVKKYFLDEKYEPAMEDPTASEEEREMMKVFDAFFRFVRYPKNIDEEVVTNNEVLIDELKEILTPYPKTSSDVLEATAKVAQAIALKMKEEEGDDGEGREGEEDSESMKRLKEKLGKLFEDSTPDSAKPAEEVETSKSVMKFDYTESFLEDTDEKVTFRTGIPLLANYNDYKRQVKKDAAILSRFMVVNTFREDKTMHGLRTGKLDDNRIVDAVHGIATVYNMKTTHIKPRINVLLIIDESGSMSGQKSQNAAKVAVLLETAFKINAIGELFIYGFNSDASWKGTHDFNQVIRYREPGLDVKGGLGDVRGRNNNRDGQCIRAIIKRVREFTKEPMLMFVISDGAPSADRYGGYSAIEDTKRAVKMAEKMNFFPIQIGIESISEATQKMMFDTFVNYSTSRQMVLELRKLLIKSARRFLGM